MKNGGTLRLEDSVLSGTNLRDSAIVQRHRLFSSDRPGTGILELKNSSVELTTDSSNTQSLIHMESTDSTTPVSLQAESTTFHVDKLNSQQEFFNVATYATLSLTEPKTRNRPSLSTKQAPMLKAFTRQGPMWT